MKSATCATHRPVLEDVGDGHRIAYYLSTDEMSKPAEIADSTRAANQ